MTRSRITDIAPSRLAQLNRGEAEASNLTECLAVDFAALMQCTLPSLGPQALASMHAASGEGITRRMALAARLLLAENGTRDLAALSRHPSDTVRGWACFMVGASEGLSLSDRLALIRPLADDPHFGGREWAWLAMRTTIAAQLEAAIAALVPLTAEPSERLRRFASEATRPRGVWCTHLASLRQAPEQALMLLEPLKADPALYVQDSVANWLNDASKDRPQWVTDLCARWSRESPSPATTRICQRALRTLRKGQLPKEPL